MRLELLWSQIVYIYIRPAFGTLSEWRTTISVETAKKKVELIPKGVQSITQNTSSSLVLLLLFLLLPLLLSLLLLLLLLTLLLQSSATAVSSRSCNFLFRPRHTDRDKTVPTGCCCYRRRCRRHHHHHHALLLPLCSSVKHSLSIPTAAHSQRSNGYGTTWATEQPRTYTKITTTITREKETESEAKEFCACDI